MISRAVSAALCLAAVFSCPGRVAADTAAEIRGYVDKAESRYVSGWGCVPAKPEQTLRVKIFTDGSEVGETAARIKREPAVAELCGGGADPKYSRRGFFFDFDSKTVSRLSDGKPHLFEVKGSADGEHWLLLGSSSYTAPSAIVSKSYFAQPQIQPKDVDVSVIFPEDIDEMAALPTARYGFALWHVREGNPKFKVYSPAGDISGCSGLNLAEKDRAQYQRSPDMETRSAVQFAPSSTGLCLDSRTKFAGTLLASTPYYVFDKEPPVWLESELLRFSVRLRINRAERTADGQVYLVAYLGFTDKKSLLKLWYGAQIFDLREAIPEQVLGDSCPTCTGWPIVLGDIDGGQFGSPGRNSAQFRKTVWGPEEAESEFSYLITRANFENALRQVHSRDERYSASAEDYTLWGVFLNPEVYKSGILGASFSELSLSGY